DAGHFLRVAERPRGDEDGVGEVETAERDGEIGGRSHKGQVLERWLSRRATAGGQGFMGATAGPTLVSGERSGCAWGGYGLGGGLAGPARVSSSSCLRHFALLSLSPAAS